MLLVKRPLGPTVTPEGICENEREVNAGYLKSQKEQSDTKNTREGLKPGKPSAAERREHRQLVPKVPSVDTALPPDNAQPPSTILQAEPMPEFPTIRKSASVSRIQNRSDAKLRYFGASRESGASVETDSLGSTDLGSEASAPAAVGRNLPYRRGSGTVSLPGEVKDWKTSLPKLRHRTPSEERILRIVDIDSEEIFEAKFKKKREPSLSRNLGMTRRMKSEEHIESLNHNKEEVIYRPRQQGTPVEMILDEAEDKEFKESHSDTTAVEGKLSRKSSATSLASEVSQGPEKEMTLTRRLSARFKRTPSQDSKVNVDVTKKEQTDNVGKKVPFLRRASKDDRIKKEQDVEEGNGGCNLRKESSSLSQGIKKRIESLSMALSRSSSEDRSGREAGRAMKSKFGAKGAPGMIKRASSEIFINKKAAGPELTSKRLLKAAPLAASTECLGSGPLARAEPEKRSIWNRWEIGRGKKAKEPLGTSSSSNNQEKAATSEPSTQTTAGVKPKFNLELKDEVIVEGQPFTLHCLPEGNSLLSIRWFKDKKPLSSDGHIKTSSGADGRHILTALKATKKDVGTYECVASNSVGTESSSCRVCLAQLPGRPKQPEVPRVCKEGALVVWKAAESQGHVTYTLEAKKLGVDSWAVVAADLEDPYHNVTRLTPGGIYKFRVSCVNKAGQGQASLSSSKVTIPGTDVVPGADGSDGGKTVSSTDQASGPQQGSVQKPYTFLEERARGRFGVIRECRENSTGKVFTAKVVLYTPEGKMAALREYEVLKALRHPAILALHEAYVTPQYLVLITERCPGKELLYKLIEIPRYTEEDVVTYVVEVFEALDYLHGQRVLHLDIRSENIIISDKRHVKLIDLGSAHFFDPNDLQPLPSPTTSLECMAPEMITAGPVGPAADTWAVGVLTFTLLSGDSPFLGSSNKQTEENIRRFRVDFEKCYINSSPESKMFLKSLLSPVPQERPSTKACLKLPWLQETDVSHLRRASHSFPTWKLQQYLQGATRHRLESATRHRVLLRSSSTLK
uniref:Uncharacterized protein n=1 Tax=Eptatretus burgeri TaxID=7764 RepID=A0A8C4Q1Q0_EPTBU